ncbi:hypothetical protein FRX31_027940, partial [Thalictrum thalictroides]
CSELVDILFGQHNLFITMKRIYKNNGKDYINSMEGAALSGRQAASYICEAGEDLTALRKNVKITAIQCLTFLEVLITFPT